MIKDFTNLQESSEHAYFAKRLKKHQIELTPSALAATFNNHYKTTAAKPHTVKKWPFSPIQPESERLLLFAKWLKVAPKELISKPTAETTNSNKVSLELDFTDQEEISKYLFQTSKPKVTARLLIDAITEKNK